MRVLLMMLCVGLSLLGQSLTTEEFEKHLKNKNVFLLDVREPKEIQENGSVKGYVNIPIGELEKRMSEVPKDKLIITMCQKGGRATRALELLSRNGYKTLGSCGLVDYKQKGKELVYPKKAT